MAVLVFPKAEETTVPIVVNWPLTPLAAPLIFEPTEATGEMLPIRVGSSTGLVGHIEVRAPGVCTQPTPAAMKHTKKKHRINPSKWAGYFTYTTPVIRQFSMSGLLMRFADEHGTGYDLRQRNTLIGCIEHSLG